MGGVRRVLQVRRAGTQACQQDTRETQHVREGGPEGLGRGERAEGAGPGDPQDRGSGDRRTRGIPGRGGRAGKTGGGAGGGGRAGRTGWRGPGAAQDPPGMSGRGYADGRASLILNK